MHKSFFFPFSSRVYGPSGTEKPNINSINLFWMVHGFIFML